MPDRPGEAGSDVSRSRGTRTSVPDDAPAGKGPKRPGSPATKDPDSNGTRPQKPRTRTRTRTSSAQTKGGASSKRKAPSNRSSTKRSTSGSGARRTAPAAAGTSTADDLTTEIEGLPPALQPEGRVRKGSPDGSDQASPDPVAADRDPEAVPRRSRTTPGPRQGRRVKRVLRRIELWSVLKLSIVLYTCMYLAVLLTLVVLWGLAYSSGQIENIETFMGEVGLDNYRFYGDRMFKAVAAIGAVGVLGGTVLTVLWAALVNIISEMTGGIRVVVIEEGPVRGGRG